MAGNPNWDVLLSTTIRNFHPTLTDNFTGNNVIMYMLDKFGGVKEEDPGFSILEPLMYAGTGTVKSYAGFDLLDISPAEGITSAEYIWKQIAGTVVISGADEWKNSGSKTRMINLLQAKIDQLQLDYDETIDTQLLADGTGNGGKDIIGLQALVEDGTAWSTVGGIDSNGAGNAFWQNKFLDFTGAGNTTFSTTAGKTVEGIKEIRNMLNDCTRRNDRPNLILTSQQIFEEYMANLDVNRRYTDDALAGVGFRNILLDDVPMVWSANIAIDDLWMLNTKYIKFYIGKGRNFIMTPFQRPVNQDSKSAQVLLIGATGLSNRALQGRIVNLAV